MAKVPKVPKVEEAWLPATVPGCVHTDLLAAGKIGDPFYRLNEKDQQWIENESWEYRTTFPSTPRRWRAIASSWCSRASTPSRRCSSTARRC